MAAPTTHGSRASGAPGTSLKCGENTSLPTLVCRVESEDVLDIAGELRRKDFLLKSGQRELESV